MAENDVRWALDEFRFEPRQATYRLAREYYYGEHWTAFADNRFKSVFGRLFQSVRDNLCPAIVDSLVDRLQLVGFSTAQDTTENDLTRQAWELWQRNDMDQRSQDVHRESLLTGDGYLIVWPHPKTGEAVLWPQLAHEMAVQYDPEQPGVITRAAKLWIPDIDRKVRLNLYFPDRIEKYVTSNPLTPNTPVVGNLKEHDFVPLMPLEQTGATDIGQDGGSTIPNPYGIVPVFHFPNKRYMGDGVSELVDVIPLQDGLNKAMADLFIAMEFSSYRQRWVTGLDVGEIGQDGKPVRPPFDYGQDKMLAASDPNTKFGEFGTSDLGQILMVLESLRSEIARVSGTPLHYLFITRGDFPSGEAMKAAEARFTKKILDRQISFGAVWEAAVAFGLQIDGADLPDGYRLNALWETASPRTEREIAETALMKKQVGVSQRQNLRELGYSDDQIDQMDAEELRRAQQIAENPPLAGEIGAGRLTVQEQVREQVGASTNGAAPPGEAAPPQ